MATIAQLYHHKKEFLTFKVIYFCTKCKKRVETFWDGYTIDGNFIAGDAWWSDALDCVVHDYSQIICYNCLGNKRASDARMRKIQYGNDESLFRDIYAK